MNTQLLTLARHNFASLQSLSHYLRSRGSWTSPRSIEEDTAYAVHDLFASMAWSDRQLHEAECRLLDALLEEDRSYGNHLERVIASKGTTESSDRRVPGCVEAAAYHDSRHDSQFKDLVVNHLENLAILVILADARATAEEMTNLRLYFSELRRAKSIPTVVVE